MRCIPSFNGAIYLDSYYADGACTSVVPVAMYPDVGGCSPPAYGYRYAVGNACPAMYVFTVYHLGAKTSVYTKSGTTCSPYVVGGYSWALVGSEAPPSDFVAFARN
jgi:hypothetical protein